MIALCEYIDNETDAVLEEQAAQLLKKHVSSKSILQTKSSTHLAIKTMGKSVDGDKRDAFFVAQRTKQATGGKAKTRVLAQLRPWLT